MTKSSNAPEPVPEIISREALADKFAEMLRDTYHCTRVWSAWQVGTMSEDDFLPVEESETPYELADEVLAMLAAGISAIAALKEE